MNLREGTHRHPLAIVAAATATALFGSDVTTARADDNPVYLQWFETTWTTMERRIPDAFLAGYDRVWLPAPSECADPTSAGYDPFDRFELGRPDDPTAFGTEAEFHRLVEEFNRASILVAIDTIMNHNSGRTSDPNFVNAGGWPGFALDLPGDFWGDFHDGSTQSENPGEPNYDLFNGDLVSLIDIAHEETNLFIRQPVDPADPNNIPPGTFRNQPNPENRQFYPDLDLQPLVFDNPATGSVTRYPYNLDDPSAGDPVLESAAQYISRWCQWMAEVHGVDGFRLDAAKHIFPEYWNETWDSYVFLAARSPAGNRVTPFSFSEAATGNDFALAYTRKDGFGNRDALDLNGAARLRDLRGALGFGSWQNVLSEHLDTQDDGFNNGTRGVNHVYSHDNGSAGDGGSPPPIPGEDLYAMPQYAYLLFRPGPSIVYHHSREFIDIYDGRNRFWPREGSPQALGLGTDVMTKLVRLSNGYARGQFFPLNGTDPVNSSLDDVLVFEQRASQGSVGNCVVAVSDTYSPGVMLRSVQTNFAPGTRLHEITGNHADPNIDPNDEIPQVLTVDGSSRILIPIPNNTSATGFVHHRGYVIYALVAPDADLSVSPTDGMIGADDETVPTYARRLNDIPIVTADSFTITLQTTDPDPLDPDDDDNALFRINSGYQDYNGNGDIDFPENGSLVQGHEQFLTTNSPRFGGGTGTYTQTIDATQLEEGFQYISAMAFRHRSDGGAAIYNDARHVIYLDRVPPRVELPNESVIEAAGDLQILATDTTVNSVHVLFNIDESVDPLTLIDGANRADQIDRLEWSFPGGALQPGENTITLVAFEETGNAGIRRLTVDFPVGTGDVNGDGVVNIEDFFEMYAVDGYLPAADLNRDGFFNILDLRRADDFFRGDELEDMETDQR